MSCSQAKPNNIFNPPPLLEVNDPCERPRGREHVNIFGDSNYCIGKLKSETHESLEEGIRDKYQTASKLFAVVNFSSYPLLDFRFDSIKVEDEVRTSVDFDTVYNRDYVYSGQMQEPKNKCDEDKKDFLMNRIPKNSLIINPATPYKFLDDNFFNIETGRKKIDYYRQIRNQSNIPLLTKQSECEEPKLPSFMKETI
ncbi:hypothetical protein ACFFRR_005057 [Megaselia abdita]